MKRLLLYLFALLALLLIIFLIQNAEPVRLNLLIWSFETRRAFLVLLILLIGLFCGWTLGSLGRRRRRKEAAEPPAVQPPAAPPTPGEGG